MLAQTLPSTGPCTVRTSAHPLFGRVNEVAGPALSPGGDGQPSSVGDTRRGPGAVEVRPDQGSRRGWGGDRERECRAPNLATQTDRRRGVGDALPNAGGAMQ